MAMTRLQGETGSTPQERRAEMARRIPMLLACIDEMDDYEQRFVTDMNDNLTLSLEWTPTPRQIFKARDIGDKY